VGRRLLLVVALVAAAVVPAVAAKASPGAKAPSVRAMVLTKDDFAPGALTEYQGSKIAAVFAPVVAGMSLSGSYTRTLSAAKLDSLRLTEVFSTAFVAKSESQLASLMRSLTIATVPGSGRRAFVQGVKSGAGAGTKASLVRARTLKLGDEAVELILHIDNGSAAFDLVEIWVRQGTAVSAAGAVVFHPPTAGQSFTLAKLVAGHLATALAPAP
jgi:hypothetical protein